MERGRHISVIPSLHVKAELELKISGKLNLPMHSANVDVDVKNCGRRQIKPQLKTRCLRSLWRQLMIALYIPTSPLSSRFANCSLIDLAAWRIIYCCTGGSDKERFVLFGSWANIGPDWIPCQPLLPLHKSPWNDFAKNSNNKESGIRNLAPKTHSVCFRKQPEGMWRAKQSSNLWARELFAIDSRIYRLCHYCHLPGLAFFSLNSCSWLCKFFWAEYVTVIFWSKKYVGIIR